MNSRSWEDRAAIIAIVLVLAVFLGFGALANADLTSSRSFLFMDELISFDGVSAIYHVGNVNGLLWTLVDGGDQRYGRIVWNVMAVVGVIPYRIAGVPGLIFAARELQAVLLASAYVLLAVTFVQRWIWRAVLVAMLCALPWSVYYSTMPKPEPLQLLFLAMFFWLLKRQGWWRPWSWLFLGLAFGAKISVLPIIGVAFAIALAIQVREHNSPAMVVRSLGKIGAAFVAGWFIAVPILPLIPLRRTYLSDYIGWTFRNTGHGADNAAIGIRDWLSYIVASIPGPDLWVAVSLVLLVVVGAVAASRRGIDRWRLVPWFAGLLLLGPIVLVVKRLWGFYLHPGAVLLMVGSVASAEALLEDGTRQAARWLGYAFGVVVVPLSLLWGWPNNIAAFVEQSHRTRSDEFQSKHAMWERANAVLTDAARTDSNVTVLYEPHLFPPEGRRIRPYPFWGPFALWNDAPDFVIMRRIDTPEGPLPAPTSAEYDAIKRSHEVFPLHVADSTGTCRAQPCYDAMIDSSLPDLRIFHKRSPGAP